MRTERILYIAAIIVLIFLLFRSCGNDDNVRVIPAIKGTLHDTIRITHREIVPKEKIVLKNVPYEIVKSDTVVLEGEKVYIQPIDTLKTLSFEKKLEDEHLSITAKGVVTGRLNGIRIDYEIKERKIKKHSRWSLGVSAGVDYKGQPNVIGGVQYSLIRF